MNAAAFDARYLADADPWNYRTSPYEQAKYAATLAACGPGPFASALELGASIGVFSALLAPRCVSLTTLDASAVAVERARAALADVPSVRVECGELPGCLRPPTGSGGAGDHDLIVASEVLYYLEEPALAELARTIGARLAPGGRLVLVHWRPPGPERPIGTDAVHDRFLADPSLRSIDSGGTEAYRLDVLERIG